MSRFPCPQVRRERNMRRCRKTQEGVTDATGGRWEVESSPSIQKEATGARRRASQSWPRALPGEPGSATVFVMTSCFPGQGPGLRLRSALARLIKDAETARLPFDLQMVWRAR